jgi:hypothetical protein
MRKNILLVMTVLLALGAASYAQSSSSSSSQSSNPDTSMRTGSSASSTGDTTQTASKAEAKDLEGCIIRQETDYFVQPVNGARVHLKGGDQDLSKYVGQDVRISGRWNPYDQNNENSAQASTQPSGAPITGPVATGEKSGQLFVVTRVEKVSDTCPVNTKGNTSNPQ